MKKLFKIGVTVACVCLVLGGSMLTVGAAQGGLGETKQYVKDNHKMHRMEIWDDDYDDHDDDRYDYDYDDHDDDDRYEHDYDDDRYDHDDDDHDYDDYDDDHIYYEKHVSRPIQSPNKVIKRADNAGNTTESWSLALEEKRPYRLDVELLGGNLILAQSEDFKFVVGGEDGGKLQCYQKGDTIHVDQGGVRDLVGVGEELDVVLYLPANTDWRKIDIEIGGGTLEADSLKGQEVSIDIGAGTGTIEALEANKGDLSVAAGELVVNNGTFWNLDAEVGMGTMEINGVVNNELQAEVGMGEISMELADRQENHSYDLEYGAGAITIGKDSYGGVGEKVIRNKNAKSTYEIEVGMGSIEINFIEK